MIKNNSLAQMGQLTDEEITQPGAAYHIRGQQRRIGWLRPSQGLILGLCLVGITACSSNYTIKTTSGLVYHTQGAPDLKGGAYTFVDSEGQQQQVFLSNVSQVQKR